MDPTTTATIGAFAAAASATILALVSYFNIRALRTQVKVADFNNCLLLVKQLGEAQRNVFSAKEENDKYEFEFRELLNLLESVALLINRKKITKVSEEYSREFLCEAIAWIEADVSMHNLIEDAVTGPNTFEELKRFRKSNRKKISILAQEYQQREQEVEVESLL